MTRTVIVADDEKSFAAFQKAAQQDGWEEVFSDSLSGQVIWTELSRYDDYLVIKLK